nr:ORF1 [Torque teno midi virus]
MSKIQAKDFFTPTPYNQDTKNQIWMSQIADSHDNICSCNHPFAHLIANIFPVGHKDRDLTINKILLRDYREKCLSGGPEGASHGMADGGTAATSTTGAERSPEEEDFPEDEVDALLAAAIEEGAR